MWIIIIIIITLDPSHEKISRNAIPTTLDSVQASIDETLII